MIRALIFDFDGLVVDTEGAIFQSWDELYQSYGCDLPLDLWLTGIGTSDWDVDPIAELEARAGCSLNRATVAPQRRQRETELIAQLPLLPGVREYLQDARRLGLKVALASSASCSWVTGHLARLGVKQYFDLIVGRDDVTRTKPSPDLFLAVLQALELKATEAIVFEDSLNGLLAARQAGIFCVAVPNGVTRHLPLEQADLRLSSLAEIPLEELLARLTQGEG